MPKTLKRVIKGTVTAVLISLTVFNFNGILNGLKGAAVVSAYLNTAPSLLSNIIKPNSTQKQTVAEPTEKSNTNFKTQKSEKNKKTVKTNQKQNSSKAVTTAAKGKVLGKIVTADLTNGGANTSYKNIYFNNCTGTNINIQELANSKIGFTLKKGNQPQVLIYHTHATECYMETERDYFTETDKTRTTNKQKNMVKVGDKLAEELEKNGFSVIHDKTLHDYPSYNGSYSSSAETVSNYLKKYPSVKIIIDLHRDSIGTEKQKTAPVTEINGKKAAQVMIVMGSNTGFITNHPYWKENLKLATRLQQTFNGMYPTLSRALLLRSSLYNQNLSKGAMLIEIGTEANTLGQAEYSASLVGKSLAAVMKGLVK